MLFVKFSVMRLQVKAIFSQHVCHYYGKIDTVAKRGSMLKDWIANRDKKKHWHVDMVSTKAKVRVFEKVHKPHRRRAVLNSLFISNITDVLSTGDVAPDLVQYGIEITGVSVSQCMRTLNVFWQVSPSNYDSCPDIAKMLAIVAPKIRAELISRNVLGRVPHIFFLRDATNEKISQYELAMKKVEEEPKVDTGVVADDSFTKDLYLFKDKKKTKVSAAKIPEIVQEIETKDVPETPYKPADMKNDTCGLDHALLMNKVISLKQKIKDPLEKTHVICPQALESSDDLFSKIPGVCFQAGPSNEIQSRDAILKKFRIERKMLKERPKEQPGGIYYNAEEVDDDEFPFPDDNTDFIDDETTDNSH